MLKKRNFLKMISGITSCLAICGIFCCSILFRSDKNILNVKADNGFPSTQIQNIENYSMVGNFTGKFDFNWSYLTYSYESFPNYSSINNDFISYAEGALRYVPDSTTIKGLVWVGNDNFYYPSGSSTQVDVAFYDYINSTPHLNIGDRIQLSGSTLSVRDITGQTFLRLYNDGSPLSSQSRVILFMSEMVNIIQGSDPRQNIINSLYQNGKFYHFYNFKSLVDDEARFSSYVDDIVADYNILLDSYNDLKDYYAHHYIVNVNSHYELTYNLYWNVGDNNDFYIKPLSMKVVTDVDVSDGNGDGVEFRHGLVDELTLSSNQNIYYYTPTQCLTFLNIGADENTDLLRVYFYDGDNSEFGVFNLTQVNNFISNYQLDAMSDISYTSNILFRSQLIYYKDVILTLDDFSNGAYQTGYNDGYTVGFTNGNNQGYSDGRSEGYQAGLETNGTVISIFSGILQVAMVPVNFFLAIFNFEILGINISSFIQALLTILVTIIVLRTIFGGKGGES